MNPDIQAAIDMIEESRPLVSYSIRNADGTELQVGERVGHAPALGTVVSFSGKRYSVIEVRQGIDQPQVRESALMVEIGAA